MWCGDATSPTAFVHADATNYVARARAIRNTTYTMGDDDDDDYVTYPLLSNFSTAVAAFNRAADRLSQHWRWWNDFRPGHTALYKEPCDPIRQFMFRVRSHDRLGRRRWKRRRFVQLIAKGVGFTFS